MTFAPLAATRRLLSAPPDDQREVNWKLKDIGKLVGLYLLYSLLLIILLPPVRRVIGLKSNQLESTLIHLLSIALVYLMHTRYRRWPSAGYFGLTLQDFRTGWKQGMKWGLVIKVGSATAGGLVAGILLLLAGGNSSLLEMPQVQSHPGTLLWAVDALGAVIVAPLVEELLFRGLLYGWLRSKYGLIAGRVVSSLVFAALHGSIAVLLPTFLMGFGLALLYERTRALAPCVIAHATGNLLAAIVSVVASVVFRA